MFLDLEYNLIVAPVAQVVEQLALNQKVAGSNPAGGTII